MSSVSFLGVAVNKTLLKPHRFDQDRGVHLSTCFAITTFTNNEA